MTGLVVRYSQAPEDPRFVYTTGTAERKKKFYLVKIRLNACLIRHLFTHKTHIGKTKREKHNTGLRFFSYRIVTQSKISQFTFNKAVTFEMVFVNVNWWTRGSV